MHIAATSKFCLLHRSSLVGAVQPQDFVVVVVVDIVVRTERDKRKRGRGERDFVGGLGFTEATVVVDGREAKEGEQTKALAMSLMEVN
ncbi:hypothetical protein H5410_001159 [Solanum commersonii]|uniref:Uncharacterized protein n=1 Tax=Solanum commersonii TaxID=4109 RepID=A0A9J6AYS7_SOLCO|nr:hypothetical protein H5410_001159 [Solanum commersonii]